MSGSELSDLKTTAEIDQYSVDTMFVIRTHATALATVFPVVPDLDLVRRFPIRRLQNNVMTIHRDIAVEWQGIYLRISSTHLQRSFTIYFLLPLLWDMIRSGVYLMSRGKIRSLIRGKLKSLAYSWI